jgi:CHAD domain-containing protein
VREAEVHLDLLKRLRVVSVAATSGQVLETLERRRRRLRRAAARGARRPPVARRPGSWLARVREPVGWVEAQTQVEARQGRLRSRVWHAFGVARDSGDSERLHSARVALKRLRYALESLEEVGVRGVGREKLDELAELQENLGAVQDLATLARLVREPRLRSRALHDVELRVMIRLERRRALARRSISNWLDRHSAAAPTDDPGSAHRPLQRRTTRSDAAAPGAGTARERGSRSGEESADG